MHDVPSWVWEQAELLSVVGSTAHGISVSQEGPEGDDLDLMGFYVPSKEASLGMDDPPTRTWRSKPEGERSEGGDVDCTLHAVRKFVKLAFKGNPSILGVLWSLDRRLVSPVGQLIVDDRDLFTSKAAGRAFQGYAESQYLRLKGERGQMKVKRPELIESHGYDTKYAAHVLRLCAQGTVLLRDGAMPMPIRGADRDLVLAVRAGKLDFGDVLEEIGMARALLHETLETSKLPDVPDRDAVTALLVQMHELAWALSEVPF